VALTADPPAGLSVKLELVIVVASIARENVALGWTATPTPVAPLAGEVEVTVGGGAMVVNAHESGAASGTPSADFTVVSTAAVYVVEFASAAVGVRVAVRVVELYVTDAATGEPPLGVSVKLDAVRVVGSIGIENVTVGATATATPVAPSGGVFAVTVGVAPVVAKVHEVGPATATPSAAFTVPSSVAVYAVLNASCELGVSVAVREVAS
jgi:hypothetical protein